MRREDEVMSEVEVSGLRIGYQRKGAGAPLVLLHGGFGFDGRSWRRQIDALSDEYTVVAWDAPGCGRSSDPSPTFRLPDYADCLAGFIEALGLSRPHLLGLSFGGALALQLFDRHPAVPRTLILAGAYAGWAGSLPADEVDRRVARVDADMQQPPEEWIPSYMPGLLTKAAPSEMFEEVKSLMSGVRPAVYGDHDVRSPVEVGRALHDGIPGSSLVVLPGVGHLSCVEGAEQFNREVRSFLDKNRD
jgi:pimeloyl-ACP methyl ester carboxylesterase